MKSRIFSLIATVFAIAFIWSVPLSADETHKGKGMNMPTFADFDLDGDGKMTADEFYKARSERIAKRAEEGRKMKGLANAPSFEDIDTNDDDSISPEEFKAHQAEHRAKKHH